MQELFTPLKQESLKEILVGRIEGLILSGRIGIGQRLPSERELALQLGVSRPVVHEGLLELAARGLVVMKPRSGCVVNDYRTHGSIALLASLVGYQQGTLGPQFLQGLLDMRQLLEIENVRCAARNRTDEHLAQFEALLLQESQADVRRVAQIVELDFRFHHLVAMASGNVVYPLIINSFKQVYTNLTAQFFENRALAGEVFGFHRRIVAAIATRDEAAATDLMQRMLDHGRQNLAAAKGGDACHKPTPPIGSRSPGD